MIRRKAFFYSAKGYLIHALFILGFAVLLSACAGSHNAPRSLFTSPIKTTSGKAAVQKSGQNKALANTQVADSPNNKALHKSIIESTMGNRPSLLPSALSTIAEQENKGHYYKRAVNNKALAERDSSSHIRSKETNSQNKDEKTLRKSGNDVDSRRNEPLGIASFIVGLASFIIPVIGSIVAIILGIVSLSKINKDPEHYKGSGFAIAGIALGSFTFLLFILYLYFVIVILAAIIL